MLDIKFIREHIDLIKEAARKKHLSLDLDALIKLDNKRLSLISAIDVRRTEQNETNTTIQNSKDTEKKELITKMQVLKEALRQDEDALKEVMGMWRALMLTVPNVPDVSVPEGASDEENLEVRKVGTISELSFSPKSHIDLMRDLAIADIERGTKIAGFRGYILKGDAARLSVALWQYAFDMLAKKGYEPMLVPSLIKKEALFGTGYLPGGADDLYVTQDGEYLSGTAEVGVMGSFMDDVFSRDELPKKIVALSPCFRREAGSHGKDTKGLIRVHEFFKVEQVILCEASHEASVTFHEELLTNAEELMQALELPYRVVVNCGGDLGLGQVKKYDIEAWVPSEKKYRETHSASYFHDFQTRRLNIKYKDELGKSRFVHSLNNTLLATPRLLVSILENYQTKDGSIRVPKVLVSYMGKETIEQK